MILIKVSINYYLNMIFTQLYPQKVGHFAIQLGEPNTIVLTDLPTNTQQTIQVTTYAQQDGSFLMVTEPSFEDCGQTSQEDVLNYLVRTFVVNPDGSLNFHKSKVNYGYNKNNSFIEICTYPIVDLSMYETLEEQFTKAYGNVIQLSDFLSFLLLNFEFQYKVLFDHMAKTFKENAPLGTPTFTPVDFEGKAYSFVLVREDNKDADLPEFIMHCILSNLGHLCTVGKHDGAFKEFNNDKADVFVLINQEEHPVVAKPEHLKGKIVVQVRNGVYSSVRSLLKMLQSIKEQCIEAGIRDRNEVIKEQFDEMMKNNKDGKCTGPKEDGGCCGGGCGGGGCGEPSSSEPSSSESSSMKSGCCSSTLPINANVSDSVADMGCGMGSNCCSLSTQSSNKNNKKEQDCEFKKAQSTEHVVKQDGCCKSASNGKKQDGCCGGKCC